MFRTVAAALGLLSLLLSGLVPAGWMPQARAGSVELVICTGTGPITRTVDLGPGEAPPASDQPGAKPGACLFAGASQAGLLPPDIGEPAMAHRRAADPPCPILATRARLTADLRLPPSHGPPLPA